MKKTIAVFLMLLLLCPLTVSANFSDKMHAVSFEDMRNLPETHWSGRAVYTMAALDILKGADGHFNPLGTTTRSEALAILMRGAGREQLAELTRNSIAEQKKQNVNRFNNIDSWADGYIRLAVDYGILTVEQYDKVMHFYYPFDESYRDFVKEEPVTRLEFVEWFVRIFDLPLSERENLITDYADYKSVPGEKRLYVETALKYGLMKGDGEGLGLNRTISRQEVAQVLYNAKDLLCAKLGILTETKTVQSVAVTTEEANETALLTKTNVTFTDGTTLECSRTYAVQGVAVDYFTFFDTDTDVLTLKQNTRPEGTHLLEKGDKVTLFYQGETLLFMTADQTAQTETKETVDVNYAEGTPITATLYYVDQAENYLVLQTEEQLLEIPYMTGMTCLFRGQAVAVEDLLEQYTDHPVTVLTAKKAGGSLYRAYHMQIMPK